MVSLEIGVCIATIPEGHTDSNLSTVGGVTLFTVSVAELIHHLLRRNGAILPGAAKRRPATKVSPSAALKPIVAPVLTRLDKHERLLEELRDALDIQFKRTAAIQAQLDQLLAKLK